MLFKRIWLLLLYRIHAISTAWWIILAVIIALELVCLWIIQKKSFFSKVIISLVLINWLFVIMIATVLSRNVIESKSLEQLISFDISTAWTIGPGIYGPIDTFTELALNILIFVPVGYLLARLSVHKRWIVLGGSFLITLSIELLQLVLKRGFFELSDILLNMVGAFLGYNIYRVISRCVTKCRD